VVKLCGKCSQDKGLTLEERIELAQSRVPNTIYTCVSMRAEAWISWKHSKNGNINRNYQRTGNKGREEK
jgi:hypothetical protein